VLLADSRLVTITGPGGAGKTRLAEEFAAGLARSFEGGSAVAYLAGAVAPDQVAEVVAAAVGLRSRSARGVQAELISYLSDQRLLLVLDNCEHLAAASAALAAEVLQRLRAHRHRGDRAPAAAPFRRAAVPDRRSGA
jgi:predicted ATPase